MHLWECWETRTISRDIDPEPVDGFVDVGKIGCGCGERGEEILFEGLEVFLDLLDGIVHV